MKLAPSVNFAFLGHHDPQLVVLTTLAERYFSEDPTTCLMKLRQFSEQLALFLAANAGLYVSQREDHGVVLRKLRERGIVTGQAEPLFRGLREIGNEATHAVGGNHREALRQLRNARELAIWAHRLLSRDRTFQPGPFQPPPDPAIESAELRTQLAQLHQQQIERTAELEVVRAALDEATRRAQEAEEHARKEAEERAFYAALAQEEEDRTRSTQKALEEQTARLEALQAAAQAAPQVVQAQVQEAAAAADLIELDEKDTRQLIDEQLRHAGWEVDSGALTFAAGARPAKGRNQAIAEWPCGKKRADYVLFVGLEPLGVLEAKALRHDVPAVLEQARGYAIAFSETDGVSPAQGGPWGELKIPFLFATNGRRFLQQLRTASGVWFLDGRRATNLSRPLGGFYAPAGLRALAETDDVKADQALAAEPLEYLALRPYQESAIRAVEAALRAGRRSCLVAMATGTGKTRMAIGLAYRLLKAGRFRRILFLVDRSSLGEQAVAAFKEARMEQGLTFPETFKLLELGDTRPDDDARLHIATVQGMVRRVLSGTSTEVPTVDQYDCLIVDECHRGYNLDRDLSDVELTFRSEEEYISTYRRVLDHFDAVKIGLTATPALHTSQIFGAPVFYYSYREAVLDGFLIDHEPPRRIETALSQAGIHYKRGEQANTIERGTGLERLVTLADDVDIDIDGFNRVAVTPAFNQAVCEELARHIRVDDRRKTIVFCVDDRHADLVVDLLKKALSSRPEGPVPDQAVKKITGAATDPLQRVREFKNEELPAIAVTVDLLTTGIDVPAVCNLVFLRRVRSRILFAQMLGRATRLCPDVQKETFCIFDAVDIYGALEAESDMRPVVTRPDLPAAQLVRELTTLADPAARQLVLDELVGRLRQKQGRLRPELLEAFETRTGFVPARLADHLRMLGPERARGWVEQHIDALAVLDQKRAAPPRLQYMHTGDDHVVVSEHVFGDHTTRPEDYLQHFADFLEKNRNTLPALVAITTRPRDLKRKDLQELRALLDENGFREADLRTAWKDKTGAEVAVRVVGLVRKAALGDPLVPYGERVGAAVGRLLGQRAWTPDQRRWLEKIGKTLEREEVLDREALDQGVFRNEGGGFQRLDKIFGGELEQILGDLNEAIWQNAG